METGDSISTGDVKGQAIAIGHGAQAVYQAILRPLLDDLRALQPWLAALAERRQRPTVWVALATAITETGRCWP